MDSKPKRSNNGLTELIYSGSRLKFIIKDKMLIFKIDKPSENTGPSQLVWFNLTEYKKNMISAWPADITGIAFTLESVEEWDESGKLINGLRKENFNQIIVDKNDLTLRTTSDKAKSNHKYLKFFSKADIALERSMDENDVLEMLDHIPKHLVCRLEAYNLEQILKLIKCDELLSKLEVLMIQFLLDGVEIKPKKIECKEEEKSFIDEINKKLD